MLLPLRKPLQEQWSEYRRLEGRPFRQEALTVLLSFIESLLRSPEDIWRPWALSVAAEVVDRGGYPVRSPLFERVLFPALLAGIERREPNCARWLAGMAQHLYRCPACMQRLGPSLASEEALFRRALADDPADARARRGLIKAMATQFCYSLHELPSGVLFGADGATPAQCGELRADLAEFETLVAAEGCAEEHADLIEKSRFHFTAYEQYLTGLPRARSYADFLAQSAGADSGGDNPPLERTGRGR
jgi:hypothetical protein